MREELYYTQHYRIPKEAIPTVPEVFERVYAALAEKGYDPVNQIVGYIMSGDPTYITSHNNARLMISRIDRDDLLEEILKEYLQK